jgi:quercetin dioxygenase-like cupin family protein
VRHSRNYNRRERPYAHGVARPIEAASMTAAPFRFTLVFWAIALVPMGSLAQLPGTRVPGGCDVPASAKTKEVGCYLTATETLEKLPPAAVFWHLYEYPTRAAAEAAKPRSFGTVAESLGRVWLYVIAAKDWRPASGQRVAVIGPLRVSPAAQYTARYMEAVFPPGMQTSVHTHSGPEAWYLLNGAQCLQTPDSESITRAGQGAVVPMGPPMVLTGMGTEMRRSVVLVLHDTGEPWMTLTTDWKPSKPCAL